MVFVGFVFCFFLGGRRLFTGFFRLSEGLPFSEKMTTVMVTACLIINTTLCESLFPDDLYLSCHVTSFLTTSKFTDD